MVFNIQVLNDKGEIMNERGIEYFYILSEKKFTIKEKM